jgi:hypothetical protein
MFARAQKWIWAQNWQISTSPGPFKNIHLLETLHLAGREPRQNQGQKSKQRGDPYQQFRVPVFHSEVVNREIYGLYSTFPASEN